MDESLFFRFVLLAVLLAGSAFFAGCDIALFSLSAARLHHLEETRGRLGARVVKLLEHPQRLLVSIYVGNELINVAISAIATFIALDLFGNLGVALFLGAGAFTLLVIGEIAPKAYASENNEKWALAAAYPLTVFMWLTYPVLLAVTWVANAILSLFSMKFTAESVMLSEDELKTLMEESADKGIIGADEKEMIRNVFELGDVTVSEVMTTRTEILALEVGTPLVEAWDKMATSHLARAPVYKGNIDNITGVLFKKDLLKLDYPPPPELTLASLTREPFIVPETIMIRDLLREFKKRKMHLAIVIDEYGGVQGVASMDDILEELVGESKAAQGRNGEAVVKLGGGVYRVAASMEIEDFNEYFNASLGYGDIETVGGYVFHLFGRGPEWGESIEADGFEFTVEKVRGHRITELRVKKASEAEEENG